MISLNALPTEAGLTEVFFKTLKKLGLVAFYASSSSPQLLLLILVYGESICINLQESHPHSLDIKPFPKGIVRFMQNSKKKG
jgi:hypothetical protein